LNEKMKEEEKMDVCMNKKVLKKKKIGVLMGGLSPEREISLKTGKAILKGLLEKDFQAVGIDVDRDIPVRLAEEKIEVAFIALHGPWGEDGTIQGLLEIMGIPYTGSSVLASALAMNKVMAKKIFLYHRLPTPEFQIVVSGTRSTISIAPPLVVKPVCGGSTIGTSIVRSEKDIDEALQRAAYYGEEILVEKYVEGVDITVGVLNGEPLPVIQILPKSGFYDYASKYTPGKTEYLIPAPLPETITKRAQDLGVAAYQALECTGAARVDLLLSEQGELTILEINTIPGFTETSLLPMAAARIGIDFPSLTEQILLSARLYIDVKMRRDD
jgi:D-alanine-D-alanine ligase